MSNSDTLDFSAGLVKQYAAMLEDRKDFDWT